MVKIIFLGPPGSGKGTYSSRIGPELVIPHISTGDLLRNEVKGDSELGKKAAEYMNKGNLVPDDLVIEILKKRVEKPDCERGFILDGFPRTLNQAKALDKITNIDMVINLYLPDDILITKLSGRRVCRNCGDNYNVTDIKDDERGIYMAPLLPKKEGVCDKCGGELYQRDDDKPEVIKERLEVYYQKTKSLIDYYTEKGILKQFNVNAVPDIMVPKILKLIRSG
ncbi:MAG: adenylate kinase [Candidatus Woesearchaeota archaeon]|nr:MAG: adenylate kinase [Candidatus Woesearchaeota archaeon]